MLDLCWMICGSDSLSLLITRYLMMIMYCYCLMCWRCSFSFFSFWVCQFALIDHWLTYYQHCFYCYCYILPFSHDYDQLLMDVHQFQTIHHVIVFNFSKYPLLGTQYTSHRSPLIVVTLNTNYQQCYSYCMVIVNAIYSRLYF